MNPHVRVVTWKRAGAVGAASAVFIGLLIAADAVGFMLGNVAEWSAALGTVGALWAAVFTLRAAQHDRREERTRYLQRHAETVTAWAYWSQSPRWMVAVANNSKGVIFDVIITIETLLGDQEVVATERWAAVPPGTTEIEIENLPTALARQPFRQANLTVGQALIDAGRATMDDISGATLGVGLWFKDSAGLAWRREPSGELRRIRSYSHSQLAQTFMARSVMWSLPNSEAAEEDGSPAA